MTPHDELMALAGKWDAIAHELRYNPAAMPHSAQQRESCAADLRALLDSDAFRAMVRNDARYRWLRDADTAPVLIIDKRVEWVAPDESVPGIGGYWRYEYRAGEELDAAIDAAASGAITPPTSEGGRDE